MESSQNIRILYVEDNPGQAYLLRKRMEEVGIAVDCVATYEEALEKAKEVKYDLYLTDYVLGNANGIELIRELNTLEHFAPSLILTASGNEEVAVSALKSGAYDYVIKDVEVNYLELMPSKIEQILIRRRNEEKEIETQNELKLAARVFENSIEGILVTDAEGTIEKVNPAFTRITGYTSDEAVGKKMSLLHSDRHDREFYKGIWDSLLQKGEWKGEIWNRRKDGDVYPQWTTISSICDGQGNVLHFSSIFNDITESKQHEEEMKYQAYHDPLTSLPNRLLFQDRLQMALSRAKRHNTSLAVMFLDLDGFKCVNDRHGHVMGDALLQETANRLRKIMRDEDTVSRFGGDEFTLLFQDVVDRDAVKHLAERIIHSIGKPFNLQGESVEVGASIGVALFPRDGETAAELLKNADAAMYSVKESEKNNFAFSASHSDGRLEYHI